MGAQSHGPSVPSLYSLQNQRFDLANRQAAWVGETYSFLV